MAIIINLDVMMAKRKKGLTELAKEVDITLANLSILKNNKAKAVRFSTLNAICKALECQPGDILQYVEDGKELKFMNKSTQSGRQEELDKLSEKTEFISENIPKEHPMFQNMRARCGMFGVASMVYALFYTVCLYKNASGITYPFFVAGTLFYFCFCMKKCGVPFKKDVAFYMTSVMLLGISVFLTGDGKIVFLTKWGIFF